MKMICQAGACAAAPCQGAAAFAAKIDYVTGSTPGEVAVGDLNGDGKPDLAVANDDDNTVGVLLNQCR